MQRRKVGHISGGRKGGGPACMGGWHTWEEGSTRRWGLACKGEGRDVWQRPEPRQRGARSCGWGPWSMGGMTGGSGRVGWGGDTCEGVTTWVDGQVGGVVVGSVVMWQRGHGETSSWGSIVMVVSKGGTCH